MQEKMRHFFDKIGNGIGIIVFIILYGVAGNVLMYPYTFLAGWDENFPSLNASVFAVLLLPAACLSLFVLYWISKDRHKMVKIGYREAFEKAYKVFWWLLGYLLLPIFTNGVSLLLKWAGLTTIGNFAYEWRYESLVMVPLTILVGFIAYLYAKDWWQHPPHSKSATPPTSDPRDSLGRKNVSTSNDNKGVASGTLQCAA
ncbi:hypothetical protein KJ866_01770 [Patescibacteria group bacterium]|nr:hypothetical protein [Patescibacteria group bacterium]MBU2265110.1 hypothetical protein [Patescibacteria group bacterium]